MYYNLFLKNNNAIILSTVSITDNAVLLVCFLLEEKL